LKISTKPMRHEDYSTPAIRPPSSVSKKRMPCVETLLLSGRCRGRR
jgi:hypothetical protein